MNTARAAKGLTPVESGGDMAILAIEMTNNQQTLNAFYVAGRFKVQLRQGHPAGILQALL